MAKRGTLAAILAGCTQTTNSSQIEVFDTGYDTGVEDCDPTEKKIYTHGIYSASSKNGLEWTLDENLLNKEPLIEHASVPMPYLMDDGTIRI